MCLSKFLSNCSNFIGDVIEAIQLRNREIVKYSQGKKSINRRPLIVFFRTAMMRLLLVTNISLVSFFSFHSLLSTNYILWTLPDIFLGNP